MAIRKFHDIEYPVPGADTAIKMLRPKARFAYSLGNGEYSFDVWKCEDGSEPPTSLEIKAEILREIEIYEYYTYEREREKSYPSMIDQLDMLYHDIKNGNIDNGSWIQSIDAIKEKYPKPDRMV